MRIKNTRLDEPRASGQLLFLNNPVQEVHERFLTDKEVTRQTIRQDDVTVHQGRSSYLHAIDMVQLHPEPGMKASCFGEEVRCTGPRQPKEIGFFEGQLFSPCQANPGYPGCLNRRLGRRLGRRRRRGYRRNRFESHGGSAGQGEHQGDDDSENLLCHFGIPPRVYLVVMHY